MEEKLEIINKQVLKNRKYNLVYEKQDRNYFIKISSKKYKFHSPCDIISMLDIMLYMFKRR